MPIGVLLASTWEEQLKNLGATDIKTYKTSVEALEDLKVGRIQAVATDYIFSSYAIKKNHFPLKILENINAFRVDKKGWLVKKENIKLVDAVNKVLSDIIEDGTYAKICINKLIQFLFHLKQGVIRCIIQALSMIMEIPM
jgi:polar amino acid transport system substrate-binding protein